MRNHNRQSLFLALAIVLSAIGWLAVAKLVVPPVIESAYRGQSLAIFNGLISGQANHSVEKYLAAWDQIAWSILAILLCGGLSILLLARPISQVVKIQVERLHGRESLREFLILVLQVGLLVLVIRQFQLESQAFVDIAVLTFFGFIISYFLSLKYRLPFFLLLSLAGIFVVFGFSSGIWLVGIGLVLVGICHLPLSFVNRVALLLLTGAVLATMRIDLLHAPWSAALWPILGSMFMFRLIVYLYDLRHEKEPVSVARSLSYFFMLPNVCFPLFPVVDYKTFGRTYHDDDHHKIYQVGVQWMVRGVAHLLLYRLVYYYLVIGPSQVDNPADLVRFLVSNFLLYLRVSGQFHIIVGMLHLFGFNLPETHHLYYLSSSFTDFWRRINIYWKDFMMKIFYYPCFFYLRRWGTTTGLVLSTLVVFFLTWFLHSYQWFWIRGSFLLAWNDVLFWSILALLVTANSLYEARHGRKRTLGKRGWTLRAASSNALHVGGTFATICVLWSLWTSESVSEWLSLWTFAGEFKTADTGWLSALFTTALLVGVVASGRAGEERRFEASRREFKIPKSDAATVALLIVLCFMGTPLVYERLNEGTADIVRSLRQSTLSQRDTALLERGYYENLMGVDRFNSQLWEVYMKRPGNWPDIPDTEAARSTGDFLKTEFVPSTRILFHGKTLTTNRWGMRDKDYYRSKPQNTYRIALLGSSHVMGSGVADDEVFESLVEKQLNEESKKGANDGYRYEILNFAFGGYSPLRQLMVLEKKVSSFEPDAILYVAHWNDMERSIQHLAEAVRAYVKIPYDYLTETAQKAGIEAKTPRFLAERRLSPYGGEIMSWVYHWIVQSCRQRGVLPLWVFLPRVQENPGHEVFSRLMQLAEEAGFIVLDSSGIYKNQDIKSLHVAEWDDHPNAKGHELIAARLYEALLEQEEITKWMRSAKR